MKRRMLALCALLLTLPALAAIPAAVRQQIESSRLVTGTITVDEQGQTCSAKNPNPLGRIALRYTAKPSLPEGFGL